jgi:hypothetical protein
MIRPFIEQATPHGVTMDSERNDFRPDATSGMPADKKSDKPAVKKSDYVGFTADLSADRLLPKLRELNADQGKQFSKSYNA